MLQGTQPSSWTGEGESPQGIPVAKLPVWPRLADQLEGRVVIIALPELRISTEQAACLRTRCPLT